MTGKITRREMTALLLTVAPFVTGDAAFAQKSDAPLVLAFPSLGREVFTPLDGTASELFFASSIMEFLVYRGLGDDNGLYPGLAQSWKVSDDGLVYTFNIRKGVPFHKGYGELNAGDVVYSFNLIGGPASKNPRKFVIDWIDTIKTVGADTVQITLKSPQPSFIYQISSFNPYFMIVSKKYYEQAGIDKANRNPIGTGPYEMIRHAMSEVVELQAVEKHWRKTPDFKRLNVRIVPEERTRLSMLQAGEADLIFISGSSVDEIKRGGFKLISNKGAYYTNLVFGGQVLETREGYDNTSPWASKEHPERSKEVREALCMAINTPQIINKVLQGTATRFGVNQFLPGGPYTRDAWTPPKYDPKRAKELLAKAGYPNGFGKPITMLVIPAHGAEMADLAEAVAMNWEQLGLQVQRKVVDDAVWKKGWYPRSSMQRWTTYVLPSTPLFDPADWYKLTSDTKGTTNQPFESEEATGLVNRALSETDPAKAVSLRHQLGDLIYNNMMICPIALKDAIYAASKRVGGWKMNEGVRFPHNLEYISKAK